MIRREHPARRVRGPGVSPTTSCPTCGGAAAWAGNAARPFCSVTCQLIDLGAWLDERRAIPDEATPGTADRPLPSA
jgi:endogenous inhibitor of DNA gyrase (YacG/DUF329 family)